MVKELGYQPIALYTRRHAASDDGPALCRMFNQVIAGAPTLPQHLSSDHDPLFQFIAQTALKSESLRVLAEPI